MAFDPSSLLDASHLVTFLGGAAIGCAGQYFGDRFTDQRRAQQVVSASKKRFLKLFEIMSVLMLEMSEDLNGDETAATREFVILPNRRVGFNSTIKRFYYFEEQHIDVKNQVELLIESGFVQRVHISSAPIFRMREDLVDMLKALKK
jgi:hypothetical protein